MASVTAASRHWHGTHQLAAGLNVAGLTYSQSAQRGEIQALRADGTLVRQSTFAVAATPKLSNTQAGGYPQDTWPTSNPFLVQAGLRTAWKRFTQSAPTEARLSWTLTPFANNPPKLLRA